MGDNSERLAPEHKNSQSFTKPLWVLFVGYKISESNLMELRDMATS